MIAVWESDISDISLIPRLNFPMEPTLFKSSQFLVQGKRLVPLALSPVSVKQTKINVSSAILHVSSTQATPLHFFFFFFEVLLCFFGTNTVLVKRLAMECGSPALDKLFLGRYCIALTCYIP